MSLNKDKIENLIIKLTSTGIPKDLNLVTNGGLFTLYGSRSLPWRIFLGLLSEAPSKWESELVASRKIFTDLLKG